MKELAVRLLKEKDIRITSHRIAILCILLNDTSKAFSSPQLLRFFKNHMNRSTVYRSLDSLLENELILKMVDINGDTIYALNYNQRCKNTIHPHMKCSKCGTLQCLPLFPIEFVKMLLESGVDEFNVVFGGICSSCSENKDQH